MPGVRMSPIQAHTVDAKHLPLSLDLPHVYLQVVSYHTHIPHYIPQYTWRGLVEPMWKVIRFCTLMADLTLVPSKAMKVRWCE